MKRELKLMLELALVVSMLALFSACSPSSDTQRVQTHVIKETLGVGHLASSRGH